LIKDVADLYELTPMKLLTLEGFAEKSAQQLVDAIQASKKQPLSTLLHALGIRHVGAGAAKLLARQFGTMKALRNASVEQIAAIRGVGNAIAEAVAGFFDEAKNRKLLERLEKLGLNFKEPTATEGKGPLAGQVYVVTGTLPSLSRAKAIQLIEAAGGHVVDSVSRKTTALVAGAGGYDAFRAWLSAEIGVANPDDLDAGSLNQVLSAFFLAMGWGTLSVAPLGSAALTVDSGDWAEAEPGSAETPMCFFTSGMFADFLGRLSGEPVAVMEVECRSRN